MSKHTPGPWKVVKDKTWGLGVEAVKNPHGDPFQFPIVDRGSVGGDGRGKAATGGTPEANARLISAAPDLYDVACRIRDVETLLRENGELGLSSELLAALDAAIAKAAGDRA